MIENVNVSRTSSNEEYVDVKKYVGVASVSVVAINPNNNKLRIHGWNIPEGAPEPVYVTKDAEGKPNARIRFLVQIHDLEEKPVIPIDFWIRPEVRFNKDRSKCEIIDGYGRTSWATKSELQSNSIPTNANGPAKIDKNYKPCHSGEDYIVAFIMKLLNVTPLETFDRVANKWVSSQNPGRLTVDNWEKFCQGNVDELKGYVALQPDNRVKIILGVKTTDDNKSFQTFLPGDIKSGAFITNGVRPAKETGEYSSARKAIDRFDQYHENGNYVFSALPVREWKLDATEVKETVDDMPDFGNETATAVNVDNLPFDF